MVGAAVQKIQAWRLRYLAGQFARPRGWAGRWVFGAWLDRANQAMNGLALEQLRVKPGERVLEVGFGGGQLLAALLQTPVGKITAIDISDQMVARAHRRFKREIAESRLRVLRAPVERIPLEDGSIDKACSVNTIYFWKNPGAAFGELARVLRPGGRLVLGLEAPETLRAWPGHRYGFAVYGQEDVIGLALSAGFRNPAVSEGVEPKFGRILCVALERG